MPTAALLLVIATLLPAASFLLLAILGKQLGRPLAGWVATAIIGGSLACSLGGMIAWFNRGELAGTTWGPGDQPIEISVKWIPIGAGVAQDHPGFLDAVIYVDSLTIAMFNTATLVALLVHIYCIGHLRGHENFSRCYAAMGFLLFAALGVFLSGSLLQLFVFWQLVALGTFLLSGFWHGNAQLMKAASKSYLLQILADVPFVFALGILVHKLGNTEISDLIRWLAPLGSGDAAIIHLPAGDAITLGTETLVGLCLLCAAAAKSMQFLFFDSSDEPSPGTAPAFALIQSVGGAAAGVFLLARLLPIFTPHARIMIAVVGLAALSLGTIFSAARNDLHEILSFNTVSQFGYIFLALGIGSWLGGLFLLITHAFSKTLLFLSSGIVSHHAQGTTDLARLGGLLRKLPFTAMAFAVGALATVGVVFSSGYYSHDMLMTHVAAFAVAQSQSHLSFLWWLFLILPAATIGLTAFALMRCWMLIFWGRARDPEIYDEAREPAIVWLPMAMLAGITIVGGSRLLEIKGMLAEAVSETENFCFVVREPDARPQQSLLQAWPVDVDPLTASDSDESHIPQNAGAQEEIARRLLHQYIPWMMTIGVATAALLYLRGYAIAALLLRFAPLRWVLASLRRRILPGAISFNAIASLAIAFAGGVAAFDRRVIDGLSDFWARVFGGSSR